MPPGGIQSSVAGPAVSAGPQPWRIEVPTGPVHWTFQPPGDRLASLCALAAAALASGPVQVWGLAECEATISLRRVLALLGVQFVPLEEGWLTVTPPAAGLQPLAGEIDCGADLDTLLLALGLAVGGTAAVDLVSACDFPDGAALAAAERLLAALGAAVRLEHAPGAVRASVTPSTLHGAELPLPLSLHLLKPLALLAACAAEGESTIVEAGPGPDHLERALALLGAHLPQSGRQLTVRGGQQLSPRLVKVPPDLSAAAPLIAAAAARPGTMLDIPMTGLNPGRAAFLRCLQRTKAAVARERDWQFGTEPVSALRVEGGSARTALQLAPNAAAGLLPEFLPVAAYATQLRGESRLRGAELLRRGLPDRLALAAGLLRSFGATAELLADGLVLHGPARLEGAEVNCADDPDLGRMGLTLALLAAGPSTLHGMAGLERCWPGLRAALP
jgi:3-phosphoshikimate 1-carboxyvinyltransferase